MCTPATKRCSCCGEDKAALKFSRSSREPSGLQRWCKACHSAETKRWRQENPNKALQHDLVRYGITPKDYDGLLVSQAAVCAICHQSCGSGKRLSVDHCHATGRVRGLLCGNCNKAIGLLKDDTVRLASAIQYLNRQQ